MANNVIAGQRFYVAKTYAQFAMIPELSIANINLIYWLDSNGLFQVFIPGSGFNTLTSFVPGESYQIAAKVALDLTAYLGVPSGGSTGPLVNIPVTVGQTVLTISNKQISAISAILRGGYVLTPITHYTLSQSGSDVLVTLAEGVQPVRPEEVDIPTSFQYQ